jgi:hypothetical protein
MHHRTDLVVGHDAPRDEAGDLPDQHFAPVGDQSDGGLLVVETGLFRRSVTELASIVMSVANRSTRGVPVHMAIEHVHENRNP